MSDAKEEISYCWQNQERVEWQIYQFSIRIEADKIFLNRYKPETICLVKMTVSDIANTTESGFKDFLPEPVIIISIHKVVINSRYLYISVRSVVFLF